MITDVESQITMLAVIVALLTRLSGLEILTYDFAHFFGFRDQVIAKKLAFACFRPVERGTTLSAIENFKRCFACTCLENVVVRELGKWKAIFPFHTEGDYTCHEHIFKDLVHSFDLTTSLRVKSCAEANLGTHS